MSMKIMTIDQAIKAVRKGWAKKILLEDGTIVYKVPSNNPAKYTIRVDVKVVEKEC